MQRIRETFGRSEEFNTDWGPSLKWPLCFLLTLLLSAASAIAQSQPNTQSAAPVDHPLRIFLLTFGPGAEAWEKFGHNAIVVTDTATGESVAYNWGVFEFGEGISGFLSFSGHFLQGRLLYSMESEPTSDMLEEYKEAHRSIFAQELNLTAEQKIRLQARLIANDTDANRYYLYDYFKKNCATMARDAIDQTIDGRLHATLENVPTATTYRWHDRRTCADTLWLYLFLDFALGHPVDRPLSAWQECFLPGKLAEHLKIVQVPDEQGKLVPLVANSEQLNEGIYPERTEPPASYVYWLFAASSSLALLTAWLGSIGARRRLARWAFRFFAVIWSLMAGTLGALLVFIWFTNHDAAKWNENLSQCNPISLLLIVLVPAASRWPRAARTVALAALGLCVFGIIAKLSPWAWQSNGPIIAIALPLHAGVAWGIWRLKPNRDATATECGNHSKS